MCPKGSGRRSVSPSRAFLAAVTPPSQAELGLHQVRKGRRRRWRVYSAAAVPQLQVDRARQVGPHADRHRRRPSHPWPLGRDAGLHNSNWAPVEVSPRLPESAAGRVRSCGRMRACRRIVSNSEAPTEAGRRWAAVAGPPARAWRRCRDSGQPVMRAPRISAAASSSSGNAVGESITPAIPDLGALRLGISPQKRQQHQVDPQCFRADSFAALPSCARRRGGKIAVNQPAFAEAMASGRACPRHRKSARAFDLPLAESYWPDAGGGGDPDLRLDRLATAAAGLAGLRRGWRRHTHRPRSDPRPQRPLDTRTPDGVTAPGESW